MASVNLNVMAKVLKFSGQTMKYHVTVLVLRYQCRKLMDHIYAQALSGHLCDPFQDFLAGSSGC